jgi:uncharacterized protein (TIGR02145 family)
VEWDKDALPTLWSDSMWVFVDYNKNGKMERLLISGGTLTEHTATKTGTGIFIPENDMGAWVYGDARSAGSFSAKVQLFTKETDIIIAGACAYASSYPPVSNWISDAKLGFTGTPMYEITLTDGSITVTVEAGSTFLLPCSYTVSSFTDRTGAPGIINCMPPTSLTLASTFAIICPGESITLTASASGAVAYSLDGINWQASTIFNESPVSPKSYTLYAKTDKGCVTSVTDAAAVAVNPLPANLTLTATPAVICNGESTTLTAKADYGVQYCLDGSSWGTSTTFSMSPPSNASYTLHAKTAAGCTASVTDAATVTVNPVPAITAVSPTYGEPAGGAPLTITGTNFMAGATVTIGGTACTGVTVNSSTEITCITPAKAEGTYPVVVTTPYCTSNTDITFTHVNSMQNFTAAACDAMAINQVITLTDIRNNRIYHIIKLKMSADGSNDHCWMQENLAIAGITIIPENSNVTTDFTIPAVITTTQSSDYTPNFPAYRDYSPYNTAPYGYLYNWANAIAYSTAQYGAGSDNSSYDITTGNAQYSICPKGWRLPTAGTYTSTNEFSLVDIHSYGGSGDSRMNDPTSMGKWTAPSGFAAVYTGTFVTPGSEAHFWSASVYNATNAYSMYLTNNNILSLRSTYDAKFGVKSIRCVK